MTISELLENLEDNEFDMDWNQNKGIIFRNELIRLVKEKEMTNAIVDNMVFLNKNDVLSALNQPYPTNLPDTIQNLPTYSPIPYEHRYSDSTMKNMTKEELINQIHCLVNNNDALQERINNQFSYLQKLITSMEALETEGNSYER